MLEGKVYRTKLAVKAATNDHSHKLHSHISLVIWNREEKEGRTKVPLPLPFYMSSLSCMKEKHRATLVIMTPPPKLIFHIRNRRECLGSYYLNRKIVKTALHYVITLYSHSIVASLEPQLELHHFPLSIGFKAFCTSLNSDADSLILSLKRNLNVKSHHHLASWLQ